MKTIKKAYQDPHTTCVEISAYAYVMNVVSGQGPNTGQGGGSGQVG